MINNAQNTSNSTYGYTQRLRDRSIFENFAAKPQKVTRDEPRGYLVKENPVQQLGSAVTDTVHDVGNLASALKDGNANDTELGRLNDLGMKIGGGIIAAMLMGTKSTTNKKIMEVAGFATFFSTMALWPKLMIDLPTKLRFGFNPHQKYVDSNGNKKAFSLDNGYLPWDVWPKEEINRIGDKMGVDKNLEDREEYIKEKMRTIQLQDNTLWMLSAGFATPLVTSLVCNRIEEGLRVPVANSNLLKLHNEAEGVQTLPQKIKSKFDGAAQSVKNVFSKKGAQKAGTGVFAAQDAEFDEIISALRRGEMPENLSSRLDEILDVTRFTDNEQVAKSVRKGGAGLSTDLIERLFPDDGNFEAFAKELAKDDPESFDEINDLLKRAFKKAQSEGAGTDIKTVMDYANGLIDADFERYADCSWVEKFDGLTPELKKAAETKGGRTKETLQRGADKLEEIYRKGIKPAQEEMRTYGDRVRRLDGISGERYNKTAEAMLKALGLSDKELKLLSQSNQVSGSTVQDILTEKIKEIASDDTRYHKTMAKLNARKESIGTAKAFASGEKVSIDSVFDEITGSTSKKLQDLGSAIDADGTLEGSSIKGLLSRGITETDSQNVRTSITSVDSMIARLTNAIDLERKIQDGSVLEDWAKCAKARGLNVDVSQMSADECENLYKTLRKVAWQSTYGDLANKMHMGGNGGFYNAVIDTVFTAKAGTGDVQDWKNGALAIARDIQYFPNQALESRDFSVRLNQLKWEWANANNATIGDVPAEELEKMVKRAGEDVCLSKLKNEYKTIHNIVDDKDIPTEELEKIVKEAKETASKADKVYRTTLKSHKLKSADFGEPILNTFKKKANEMYISKSWMKIFGGMTAVLIGATLISQLFFGKVKDADKYTKKTNGDSFESGNNQCK